ncbi:hypothetical protein PInf_025565 [Phytophthora infestans]|nr:hypothetical protein PInf_025565 [Phytophthora infestans]
MQFGVFFFFLLSAFGAVAEDPCPATEVVKFAELYANPHLSPCQKVSAGFSIAPPKGYPTDPQVKAMCASDECRALIEDALALKPADCYLSFAGVKLNAYKLSSTFEDACKADMDKTHEDDKHPASTNNSTLKPTEEKSTLKPAVEKYPKATEEDMLHTNEKADEANNLKPPMNGTALELFPMPNTTYKATTSPKA